MEEVHSLAFSPSKSRRHSEHFYFMTPADRIQAALMKSQAKPPAAKFPMPPRADWIATSAQSSVTVSEENLAALLRSLTSQ